MIVLYLASNPRYKIFYDGKAKVVDIKDYNNKFDQGIGDVVDDGTIIGIFVEKGLLYLLLNDKVLNITDQKVECINQAIGNTREFTLKVNDAEIYKTRYAEKYTIEDIIAGEDPEDLDFLIELSGILKTEESINKFMTGFSKQR